MIPAPAQPAVDHHGCQTPACWHRIHVRRREHWKHQNPWRWAFAHLSSSTRAMLVRLRGCEARGKPPRVAYALKTDDSGGPHRGAYQYLDSTWLRTIPFLPRAWLRSRATRGPAYTATGREQDVRTAYFYPSHRSEWECVA